MRISHERDKLADAVIFFVTKTAHCGVTKLLKLLFFLDFEHFRQTAKSVTGLEYRAWPKGPAPYNVWREIKRGAKGFLSDAVSVEYVPNEETGKQFAKIRPLRAFDGRYFSRREMRILSDLAEIYRDATADEIVEVVHLKNSPWHKTLRAKGEDAVIDYMLALDGKSPRELPVDEIRQRLEEFEEERQLERQ